MHMEGEEEEEEEVIRLDLEQTRIDVKGEYNLNGFFDKVSIELRSNLSHSGFSDRLKGSLGLQWIERDFEAVGEEAFIPASEISGLGVYVIESIESGDFTYEGGLRFDKQTVEPGVEELFSNVGAGCVASTDPADFVEHAATGRLEIGDATLDKETATKKLHIVSILDAIAVRYQPLLITLVIIFI